MTYKTPIPVNKTVPRSLKPYDIHGNWVVTDVKLEKPTTTIGILPGESKFKIRRHSSYHVLEKTANVDWNGASTTIKLGVARSDVHLNSNIALVAKIKLDGEKYELGLGSDDSGSTLKIQLVPTSQIINPGGAASGGRGL